MFSFVQIFHGNNRLNKMLVKKRRIRIPEIKWYDLRMLLLHKFFICRCVNVCGSKNVGQNRSVKCFAGFVKFMVNLSYNTVLLLVVFGIFFHFWNMSHSYLIHPLKRLCISAITWVISISIFTFSILPAAQISCMSGLQEDWDFTARDLYEDQQKKSFLPLLYSTWGHGAELSHIHVPHMAHPSRTLLPVWWGLLPAGGFCDQPPRPGAAATASGGCLSASECRPGAWGSFGWAPSPSSSHLHIQPCVSCTLLQEPSTRTANMSAQLIPHQPRGKSGSYSLLLSRIHFQEPHVLSFHHLSLYPHLSWTGKEGEKNKL